MVITSFLISLPSLKFNIILYLSPHMMLSTLLILAVRTTHVIHEPSIWLVHHQSLLAQWLEHPTGVWKVNGSIPVGDSHFFFVPRSRHDVITCFLISLASLKFTIILQLSVLIYKVILKHQEKVIN